MNIPFMDLSVTNHEERTELLRAFESVLSHGLLINGPELDVLEERFAAYCERKYSVGVGSGSEALYLALRALNIGPGDEVITTALSWVATANAIALTGATPLFSDIGEDLNIDPISVEKLISPKTKAIVPVHFTGKVCNMEALEHIVKGTRVFIIEDAAQAFGAKRDSKMAGSFGLMAIFSLNAMKIFSSLGEAGMVVTDDKTLYDRLYALRYNGTINPGVCVAHGLNARMDTLQASFLLTRMNFVDTKIKYRRERAGEYTRRIKNWVIPPKEEEGEEDCYYSYTIRAQNRDALKAYLGKKGVECKIQHPILLPDQPAHRFFQRHSLPNARRIVREILSLPISEKITSNETAYIGDAICQFYQDGCVDEG